MQRPFLAAIPLLALATAAATPSLFAADWPHWRGPNYNGISDETAWKATWPAEGPKLLWKAATGTGFSSITVANGKAYTMGNFKSPDDTEEDVVFCFNAETGAEIWKFKYECPLAPQHYEGGTLATPTIDGNAVYTISKKGHVFCFSADKGEVLWKTNIVDDLKIQPPTWGFSGSGYIHKDLVIFNVGAAGIAFNKKTGAVVWKSDNKASGYSTAVPFTVDGKSGIALMTMQEIQAINPENGAILWSYPWKTSWEINAADPIFSGSKVFFSSGYNHGATVLEIKDGKLTPVWENKQMRNHFNSCVLVDGYLYGIDGEAGDKATLKCIEFATGTVKWTQQGVGSGSVTVAGKKLIILSNTGLLMTADVTPDAFKLNSKAQVLSGKCWTVVTLANGRLYCRNNKDGNLLCFDVK
jgi:outer membrane protein assembly factor BamB